MSRENRVERQRAGRKTIANEFVASGCKDASILFLPTSLSSLVPRESKLHSIPFSPFLLPLFNLSPSSLFSSAFIFPDCGCISYRNSGPSPKSERPFFLFLLWPGDRERLHVLVSPFCVFVSLVSTIFYLLLQPLFLSLTHTHTPAVQCTVILLLMRHSSGITQCWRLMLKSVSVFYTHTFTPLSCTVLTTRRQVDDSHCPGKIAACQLLLHPYTCVCMVHVSLTAHAVCVYLPLHTHTRTDMPLLQHRLFLS